MRLKQLIKALDNYRIYPGLCDFRVEGISCNSRGVKDNYLFVAIKGSCADGHAFINEAIAKGSRAIVVDGNREYVRTIIEKSVGDSRRISFIVTPDTRQALARLAAKFYGHPASKIKIAGITGTNGKTTVAYLIEALLKNAGNAPAVLGTINYRFKDKVIPAKNTTPGPLQLQAMLAQMRKSGIDYLIMEVSSHALDQERVAGLKFTSAIFTNLTQDHLDYHKTMKNYFQSKRKLFHNLSAGSCCIINNDDSYGRRLKKTIKTKVITYAIDSRADVVASDIKLYPGHTEFILQAMDKKINFKTRLIGRHNVYNILASVAWAINEGLAMPDIKSVIGKFVSVPGRLESIDSRMGFRVFVDYAHTPDALVNVIKSLRQLAEKKIIVVFGCGGERDKTKRPLMGKIVSELADYAIITSDNPRSEPAQEIIRQIEKGIAKNNYCLVPDRLGAIKKSLSLAHPGDIVLIAGKGHETYQILKDRKIHFDDREAVRECLELMNC